MYLAINCVLPINDIRGVENMSYAKGEKIIRCKLAAVFRLMDLFGWSQGIYNQVSVIINVSLSQILIIIIELFLGTIKSRRRTFFS